MAGQVGASDSKRTSSRGGPFTLTPTDARGSGNLEVSRGGSFRLKIRDVAGRGSGLIFQDRFETGDASRWSSSIGVAELPCGAVLWLWATSCPSGWSELLEGRGRTVVGLRFGGVLGATWGSPLADLEAREHQHDASLDVDGRSATDHGHWTVVFEPDRSWRTFTPNYAFLTMIDWGNGIDNSGSGIYPFASPPNSNLRQIHGTSRSGVHSHTGSKTASVDPAGGTLPYVQMKLCRKE